jgi:hypothetical protein
MSKFKENLSEALGTIGGILLYGGVTVLMVLGIVHAFNKHGAGSGAMSIFLPPVGLYYGVEMIFHNEDWDKKLSTDMENCVYLIDQSGESKKDKFVLNEEIETFTSKIKDYPKKKISFLKTGAYTYLRYNSSLSKDIIAFFNDKSAKVSISDSTTYYEKELTDKYYMQNYFKNQNMAMKVWIDSLNSPSYQKPDNIDEIKTYLPVALNTIFKDMQTTYDKIFVN